MNNIKEVYQELVHELESALKKVLPHCDDKKSFAKGELVLVLIQKGGRTFDKGQVLIGPVERSNIEGKVTIKYPIICDHPTLAAKKALGWLFELDMEENAFYKIRNPKPIEKILKEWPSYHVGWIREEKELIMKIFEKVIEDMPKTHEQKFLSLNQELPIELESMEPEKRLEVTKKLEKLLVEKVEGANPEDIRKMEETKELLIYAQKIGVESTDAEETYKEKTRALRKVIRKKIEL